MKRKRTGEAIGDILKTPPPEGALRRMIEGMDGRARAYVELRAALAALHSAVAELLGGDPSAIPPAILAKLRGASAQAEAALLATGEG